MTRPLALRLAVCALILLLAALLRLHELGAQSLWYDEGNSYIQSTRSFTDIADHAARDIHPPGYYWLLAGWRLLVGESEFGLRSLSAFASIITVALTFAVGRRLGGGAGGALAALLVAINSFQVYYAQEARMYALLALWATASLYALLRLIDRPTRRALLLLGVLNAAGLWTHYAFPFFMLAQGVIIVLAANRRALLPFAAANLLALALFAAWMPAALNQVTTWGQVRDSVPPLEAIPALLRLLTFGIAAADTAPALALALLLMGVILRRGDRLRLIAPVSWVIVPAALFLAFDLFREANLKFLLPAQVGAALWLARGAGELVGLGALPGRTGRRLPALAAAGAALWLLVNTAAQLPRLYTDPALQRPDYRAAAARIAADARPNDAIILNAPNQIEVFGYYYDGDLPIYPLPAGLGGDDDAARAAVEAVIAAHERAFALFYGENERDPNRIIETTLDTAAFEVGDTWYGDLRLARYAMPTPLTLERESGARFGGAITLVRYALSGDHAAPGSALQIQLVWRTDALLSARYKVFVQLLNAAGVLVAQRDSEPGGGLALTSTWMPAIDVIDNHALPLPVDLPPGGYTLIVGLYDVDDPAARLPVADSDYLVLTPVRVE